VSTIYPLKRIKLPKKSLYNRLHVFAISIVPAVPPPGYDEPAIAFKDVRATSRLVEEGPTKGDRIVEVTISNLHPHTFDYRNLFKYLFENYTVHVVGQDIVTTVPGRIRRLMPGDDFRVDVAVRETSQHMSDSYIVGVELRGWPFWRSGEWTLTLPKLEYEASWDSLSRHETPLWVIIFSLHSIHCLMHFSQWRNSKFGIL